ncbi:glycosyltransferase family 39 protein [Embleya hyalina]|nr:glycosyltransferase family 39 protein [Embleya hyalina]
MLLTFGVGLYKVDTPELWRDELASLSAADRSVPQLLRLLEHVDTSSGAYYFFMHCWMKVFGDSVLVLRLPSVLAMAATAGCLAAIGRRMLSARAGVLAALVFAVIPSVSRYAQEVRSYALTMFMVTLATLMLLRALEQPRARRAKRQRMLRWLLFGGSVAVAGLLSLVSLAVLPAFGVLTLLEWRRQRDRRVLWGFVSACVGGVSVLIPVAVKAAGQASAQISWIPEPSLTDVGHLWPQIGCSYAVSYGMAACLVLLLLLAAFRRIDRTQALTALTLAVLPVVVVWLVSQGGQSYWLARYLLFIVPAWALVAGAVLSCLGRVAAVSGLVVVTALGGTNQVQLRARGSHDVWDYPHSVKAASVDYEAAAKVIQANHQPGDGLVTAQWLWAPFLFDVGLRYYLPEGELGLRKPVLAQTANKAGLLGQVDTAQPRRPIGSEPRLWLVTLVVGEELEPYRFIAGDIGAALQAHYRIEKQWRVSSGAEVALLVRIPSPPK